MKKLIALGLGLAAFSFNASAATLGPGDLVAIEETFKENEIRFKRL